MHPVTSAVAPRRSQYQLLAHGPEAQQTNAELALEPGSALSLETLLHRVANVRGDIFEVRNTDGVAPDAFSVIFDPQELDAFFLSPRDRDAFGARIDAVLHELGHRFERIALRKSDDSDGVPVIPDAELACVTAVMVPGVRLLHRPI